MAKTIIVTSGLKRAIELVMSAGSRGITIPELAKRMRRSTSTVDHWLRKLEEDGFVKSQYFEGVPYHTGRPPLFWTWNHRQKTRIVTLPKAG